MIKAIQHRTISFLRKQKRAIFVSILVLVTAGALSYHFRVHLLVPENIDSTGELIDYVESPDSFWRGTHYVGDQDESSLFLHQASQQTLLAIPAVLWEPPKRFPLTHDQKRWIK